MQASIIENISRADLNPIEEAQAYQRMIDEFHYLHEEVAASVGKSRAAITNSLRLLKLEPRVQNLLISGQISEGHGKFLAGLEPHQQVQLAELCVQRGLETFAKWKRKRKSYSKSNPLKALIAMPILSVLNLLYLNISVTASRSTMKKEAGLFAYSIQ